MATKRSAVLIWWYIGLPIYGMFLALLGSLIVGGLLYAISAISPLGWKIVVIVFSIFGLFYGAYLGWRNALSAKSSQRK